MVLAAWVRASIWKASDWRAALAGLCDDTAACSAAELVDLARACELIDIDRRRALAMYRAAWQQQPAQTTLDCALAIARELAAFDAISELALAVHEQSHDATHLLTAAYAWLDAGIPERAIEPLSRALAARPKDDETKSALALVRREVRDVQVEVSRWVAIASRAKRDESAHAYLRAARLARAGGLEVIYVRQLEAAYHRGSREAASLIEIRLLERRRAEDLATFYRNRLDTIANERDWVDTMRAAATRLHLAGVQRGLALRLAQSGLAHAYRARLTDIPGHLALWDLLIQHARDAHSTRELMPLVIEALELPIADDERLYLARFGLEVAHEARDPEAARPYGSIVDEITSPADTPRPASDVVRVKFTSAEPDLPVVKIRKPAGAATPVEATPAPALETLGAAEPPQHAAAPEPPHAVAPEPHAAAPEPPQHAAAPEPPHAAAPEPPRHAAAPEPPHAASPPPAPTTSKAPASVIPASANAVLRRRPGMPSSPPLPANATKRAERVVVAVDVEVYTPSGEYFSAVVRDLSTTGLFVVTKRDIPIGTVIELQLELPGTTVLALCSHRVNAKIVRRGDRGYGLLLLDPSPELVAGIEALGVRSA